jgi:transcriptional regulator with XRE-family HTH domain
MPAGLSETTWSLAPNFRALLYQRGHANHSEAARVLGVPRPQLLRYLSGRAVPRPATLRRMLAALAATEAELHRIDVDPA